MKISAPSNEEILVPHRRTPTGELVRGWALSARVELSATAVEVLRGSNDATRRNLGSLYATTAHLELGDEGTQTTVLVADTEGNRRALGFVASGLDLVAQRLRVLLHSSNVRQTLSSLVDGALSVAQLVALPNTTGMRIRTRRTE